MPHCDSGGVRDTAAAEGYVHVHAGIHSLGDLDPAIYDWRMDAPVTPLWKHMPRVKPKSHYESTGK